MSRHVFLSIFILLLWPPIGLADTPPLPTKKTTLSGIEKQIEQEEQNKAELDQKIKGLKEDLQSTKDRLVSLGRSVQKNEKALNKLEKRIAEAGEEQEELSQSLEGDRAAMSRLVLALTRIRRTPPEAIFAKPDAPLKTAQSAIVLSDIIPALNNKAKALKEKLDQLDTLTRTLKADKEEAEKTAKALKKEERDLKKLLNRREKLYAGTRKDLKTVQANIKNASSRASNLRDLIGKLDEQRTAGRQAARYDPGPLTPMPSPGGAQLPISGIIKVGYNQPDAFGAKSQGMRIIGRSGGLVVAPMGGIIRFAGAFKKYGQLIIIEHKGGYHSLVAGLEKIDTVEEQSVAAGEPLGRLKETSGGIKPSLYYELRLNGRPVNPAIKFSDLG